MPAVIGCDVADSVVQPVLEAWQGSGKLQVSEGNIDAKLGQPGRFAQEHCVYMVDLFGRGGGGILSIDTLAHQIIELGDPADPM